MPKERQIKETCFLNDAEILVPSKREKGKYEPRAKASESSEEQTEAEQVSPEEATDGKRSLLWRLSNPRH